MPGHGDYNQTFWDGDDIALVRPDGVVHAIMRVDGTTFAASYAGLLVSIAWDFDEGIWTVPGDDW